MTHNNTSIKVPDDVFQSICSAYEVEVIQQQTDDIAQRRILGRKFWIKRRAVYGSQPYYARLKTSIKNKFDAVNKKLKNKIKESRWYKARRERCKLGLYLRTGKRRSRLMRLKEEAERAKDEKKESIAEVVAPQQSSVPAEVPISILHESTGSIPSGWSALDMLATVASDATPTTITSSTSMNPVLPTFAVSPNSTSSTAGPVHGATHGWGGDGSNGNNNHNNMS